jgi:hypothetical protein
MIFVPPGMVGQWDIVPSWGKWSILGGFLVVGRFEIILIEFD